MLVEGASVACDAKKVLGWSEVRQGATISIQAQEERAWLVMPGFVLAVRKQGSCPPHGQGSNRGGEVYLP